ncbi:MAG: DUF2845 domain-containing protein [Desulfosarcinaceae bacterium]
MRVWIQVLGFVLGFMLVSQASAGIRCGNDLITIGDTGFEVLAKLETCGRVIDKAPVATRTETERNGKEEESEERLIERWYIRVDEKGSGYCYPLTFEKGILIEIGGWHRCD